MTREHSADLIKEWQALHHSHEQYEHFALLIKLVAIVISIVLIIFDQQNSVILLIVAVLWLQEAIWKTYQARTGSRITLIEQALINARLGDNNIIDENSTIAFQFYNQWNDNRAGVIELIKEYLANSVKPTVIYPYLPLMVIALMA